MTKPGVLVLIFMLMAVPVMAASHHHKKKHPTPTAQATPHAKPYPPAHTATHP
jgi:hypothetical protein